MNQHIAGALMLVAGLYLGFYGASNHELAALWWSGALVVAGLTRLERR